MDAGCGPGRTALELSQHFQYVEAYDYSEGFVKMLEDEVAKRQLKNVKAYQGDAHKQVDILGKVCIIKPDLIHENLIPERKSH